MLHPHVCSAAAEFKPRESARESRAKQDIAGRVRFDMLSAREAETEQQGYLHMVNPICADA